MARRRSYLRQAGYPRPRQLRREAAIYANAALPSRRSIRRQYGRSLHDVEGFTRSLVELLRGGVGSVDSAYDEAAAAQGAADVAGRARLSELGLPGGEAAAATLGAGSRSALGDILRSGAASETFMAKQPGIGAARGSLAQLGLVNARDEALTQRGEAYRSAFAQALQQVRQNALAMAQFNMQGQQFERQMRQSNRQFRAGQKLQWAQLSEQQREFDKQLRRDTQEAMAGGGWTPTQLQGFQSDAYDGAVSAAQHGVGPQRFINEALARGIPRPVAVNAALRAYASLPSRIGARPPALPNRDEVGVTAYNAAVAARNAWQGQKKAFDAYKHWLEQIRRMQYRKKYGRRRSNQRDQVVDLIQGFL